MPYMSRNRKGNAVSTKVNKVHGIKVAEITYKEPGNGLPKWVKEAAAERGYGDALEPVSLYITDADIAAAFDCAAHGDGSKCVMAQAGTRLGAKSVYFYRTTAWVDFGTGPILRFQTSKAIYNNIIDPFDRGDQDAVSGGVYPLTPPSHSRSLKRGREYQNKHRNEKPATPSYRKDVIAHTDRVVMASQA
jgi:hypothetical protein